MKPESGRTETAWTATANVPVFPKLESDVTADVCIIGAGIAGLSTAYMLVKAGKTVVVIDDGPICGGETQRTTAHLSNVLDDRYYSIIDEHGKDKAKLAYESHTAAINLIEANIRAEKIACDFKRLDGFLFVGDKDSEKTIDKELNAAHEVGFSSAQKLDTVPLSFFPEPRMCIRFPMQAQFHVLKYLSGIAKAIISAGGGIYSGTHASGIKDGKQVKVTTDGGQTISANFLVVATNSPISDWVKIHTKQAAYRTYVIGAKVPVGYVPAGLYWDTEDPYHYIRLAPITGDPESELLIIGGQDHKTGQESDPQKHFDDLEKWARRMFPDLGETVYQWSGQVMETIDGLAFIGRDPAHRDNVFIATGDSGMGMTHGTIAGMLLTDLILGNENPWAQIYEPSRKPIKAGVEYVKENVNVAMQYADYLKPSEVDSLDKIRPGEGAVLVNNGEHIAVYCSEKGDYVQCNAVCPHLKAIVHWNDVEKSWDCPAHGSRFKATGEVINGPAMTNLAEIPPEKRIRDKTESTELPAMPPGDSGVEPQWPTI
jgi:glycine/D-amino acid oxidase-like deaminating enzyme/nitrite reductase/ring-hydroxylating ferredoxin subunit